MCEVAVLCETLRRFCWIFISRIDISGNSINLIHSPGLITGWVISYHNLKNTYLRPSFCKDLLVDPEQPRSEIIHCNGAINKQHHLKSPCQSLSLLAKDSVRECHHNKIFQRFFVMQCYAATWNGKAQTCQPWRLNVGVRLYVYMKITDV